MAAKYLKWGVGDATPLLEKHKPQGTILQLTEHESRIERYFMLSLIYTSKKSGKQIAASHKMHTLPKNDEEAMRCLRFVALSQREIVSRFSMISRMEKEARQQEWLYGSGSDIGGGNVLVMSDDDRADHKTVAEEIKGRW